MSYILIAVGVFVVIGLIPVIGVGMEMFSSKEEDVVLFSPMEGKLTFEGKSAAGAKIIRTVSWKDEVGETDIFYANENGEFNLPIKKETVKIRPMTQFVVHQKIFVYFDEKEYQVWGNGKLDKEKNTEFGGQPKNLCCELTRDPERVDTKEGWVVTSCEWNLED